MPVLFLLALVLGVAAGSLLDPPGAAVVDPRLPTLLTTAGLVLASFAAVVAASRETRGDILRDRRLAPGDPGSSRHALPGGPPPAPPAVPETLPSGPAPAAKAAVLSWSLSAAAASDPVPAARSEDGVGAATAERERGGDLPAVRTVPILHLPGSRPCYRRWLAPEPPRSGDEAAIGAWFGTVLRERERLAWHNAGIALFVPLPGPVFANPATAQLLRRHLEGEAGIDMPLVFEIEASLALGETGRSRLRAWSGIAQVLPALRTPPLVPAPPEVAERDFRFVLVDAGELLRAADLPGDGATRVADWITGLAAAGARVVVTDVRDPRIVPRLLGLGVRFASGSGLAAAGETAPSCTRLAARSGGRETMPAADRPLPPGPPADTRGPGLVTAAVAARALTDVAAGTPSPLATRLREAGLRAARAPLRAEETVTLTMAPDRAGGSERAAAGRA